MLVSRASVDLRPSPSTAKHLRGRPTLLKCYLELSKARLNAMVVLTTALGYAVAAKAMLNFDWRALGWVSLGTFLAAAGASAFNQAWEMSRDSRMDRTKRRPVPTRAISRGLAVIAGLIASLTGLAILWMTANTLTAVLGAINILLYTLVYTPLKPLSTANTLAGAVVGGIPPMMGWAAATGSLSAGAWILGAILFMWQIPHFLALAWMYRHDYAKAGFKMIATVEPTGRLTTRLTLLYSAALIPTAAAMSLIGHAGWPFALAATLLGTVLTCLSLKFTATRADADAKRLFVATIVYLPLLSTALMLDAYGPYDHMLKGEAGYSSPPSADEMFVDPSTVH